MTRGEFIDARRFHYVMAAVATTLLLGALETAAAESRFQLATAALSQAPKPEDAPPEMRIVQSRS